MELKSLTFLLPIISAICWALVYVISAKSYQVVSIPTNLLALNLGMIPALLLWAFLFKEPIDFSPYFNHPQRFWLWAVILISTLGVVALHMSLRATNATYTALIESLYLVLAPLFAYLLFQEKQWSTSTLIGGAFILVGIAFIMRDKLHVSS
jgi:drug/metabolite transporter (DMT)-like permease